MVLFGLEALTGSIGFPVSPCCPSSNSHRNYHTVLQEKAASVSDILCYLLTIAAGKGENTIVYEVCNENR